LVSPSSRLVFFFCQVLSFLFWIWSDSSSFLSALHKMALHSGSVCAHARDCLSLF
jgi:hypothetical protein